MAIKKIILVFLLIIGLLFSVLAFCLLGGPLIVNEYLKRENKDELNFSFSSCKDDNKYLNDQIISSRIDGNRLSVKAAATPNCGTTWIFGDYLITDHNIELYYTPVLVSVVGCVCTHELEYEIQGVNVKDYKITIKQQEELYSDPSWLYNIFN